MQFGVRGFAPNDGVRDTPVRSNQYAAIITRKQCEIRHTLVVVTDRKSHTGFRLVSKSMTLSDLERPAGRYFALFRTILVRQVH